MPLNPFPQSKGFQIGRNKYASRLFSFINQNIPSKHVEAGRYIVLWRGEGTKGYSQQFRQLELQSTYTCSRSKTGGISQLIFENAISQNVKKGDDMFEALQYITCPDTIDNEALIEGFERSSLGRNLYTVLASGDTYDELSGNAIKSNILSALQRDSSKSWCLRLHIYDFETKKGSRYGISKRSSMMEEQKAIMGMSKLLQTFKGPVQMKSPEYPIYIFQGLESDGYKAKMIMAKKVASSLQTSTIAPNSRICISRTPLCPLAAILMCNLSRLKEGESVLDPFSGSCSTLLAAAMVAPTCKTVGIDISDNNTVNRSDIMQDFESRSLNPPLSLIEGDCSKQTVRDEAKRSIGNTAFDVILADPPYGRREKIYHNTVSPIINLVRCVAQDLKQGRPLLKENGGRMVAFVPVMDGERLEDNLPSMVDLEEAKLRMISSIQQPLSETLSRWLVVYESIDK